MNIAMGADAGELLELGLGLYVQYMAVGLSLVHDYSPFAHILLI